MTRIINNLTRSAGRLLLTIGLAAALTSLASCTKDNGDTNPGGNPVTITLTVANLPGFSDATTTRAVDPNAPVGIPNVGKTNWVEGDQLAIQIKFLDSHISQQEIGYTWAYAIYKGGTWVLGDGINTITTPNNLPLGVRDGKVVWPARAKAILVYAFYGPGQTLAANGILCSTRPEDAGKCEQWNATTGVITTPDTPIVLETWNATCTRVRVAAFPGDVVKFAAPDFRPAGAMMDNPLSTPAGTNDKRPGEPVGYLTATADAKGNAYFYGYSNKKTSAIVSLTHSTLYGDTETAVFQNEKDFSLIAERKSYAINALNDSYNWDDTYIGTIANLNPTKSKWVITDEDLGNEAYKTLKDALNKIATASPERRISMELPKAQSVGNDAFLDCTALESITLPKARNIERFAFNGCTALKSITLPKATNIERFAFNNCEKLTTVELLVATSIEDGAFNGCIALETITLPKAMSIGSATFLNCTALKSITLPKATNIGDFAFKNCEKLATVELPVATSIGNSTFFGCIALESITLPKAINIADFAFNNCEKLATVELLVATSIGNYAFDRCTALKSITLPKATNIGEFAFYNSIALESITLPAATSIGENAFNGCKKLTTVELDAATSIGESTFVSCIALKSITLPKATNIGNGAFSGCIALKSITLPKASNIGNHAFYDCTNLATFTFGTPITKWGSHVLGSITTNGVTLTLAAGQKAMTQDQVTQAFTATASDFDFVNSGNKFCNYVFKEIKQAK